jgi:pimeloyl-ACP methyl ester carboxylesterase
MGRAGAKRGARILPFLVTAAFSVTALATFAAGSKAFPSARDFAGLVEIGGGRSLYMQCRGAGAPTVVLISGKGNGAADWGQVLDSADPAHDAADDVVGAGQGRLREDGSAVVPAVSRFTRVCAYDRPGTRIDGPDISTPAAQPQPVDQAVRDLAAALSSAGETGPYILVAHSYGGLVAALFARTHPAEVAGLVMVDAATERIKEVVSPGKLANWDAINRVSTPTAPEAVELADAIDKIDAAPPGPKVPAIVLSADKPWRSSPADAVAGGEMVTFADWLAAQDLLAASLGARHVKQTRSGHHVYLYEPRLVVRAIREVANEARRDAALRTPSP